MKAKNEHIERILASLPKTPGVYQMRDKSWKVIYVGKSVNLKSRVSSYFRDIGSLTLAKKNMVSQIADIETILCQTEVEALVLETNLIKHLTPKYNILMKDDKNLAYIKITNSPVPEVYKTRQKVRDGSQYYGPYTQWASIYQSLASLKRIFRIRSCKMQFARRWDEIIITDKAGKSIPCMDYYIGLCPAPCLLHDEAIEQHDMCIDNLRDFLSGRDTKVLTDLRAQMLAYAERHEFEDAARIKSKIEAIETLHERQLARDALPGDHDVFVIMSKYSKLYTGLMQIRDGQMIALWRNTIESRVDDESEAMIQFLARHYLSDDADLPDSLILSREITDTALLEFFDRERITLSLPTIGARKELLDFTLNQVREYAYKSELQSLEQRTLTREHMAHVLERLGYRVPKKGEIVFECYDISHTHGQFTYASRVCIANGKPDPSRYRKYKIKTLEDGEIDDYASHREVMMRRIIEGIEQDNLPDLIIIDGGKWQLSSAISGIKEGIYKMQHAESGAHEPWKIPSSEWQMPPICSIAKREEEVFIPSQKEPIMFEKGTGELMVLQKARDESHRFSITANRTARTKAMKKNILEELPGIGPVTRKALLRLAGSVDDIKNLSEGEILTVVNQKQLETLRDHGIV